MPSSFFFFFQAEDGIRDTSVTGVQTCALPISTVRPDNDANEKVYGKKLEAESIVFKGAVAVPPAAQKLIARSEERRVGKECRSRWEPDHWKNKKGEKSTCGPQTTTWLTHHAAL